MSETNKKSKVVPAVDSAKKTNAKKPDHVTKKQFNKLPEVEAFYKILYQYKLRIEAHKSLLKMYLDQKLSKK